MPGPKDELTTSRASFLGSCPARLGELFPEEILFWKKKFLWAGCRKGFNVRTSYQSHWKPRKRCGLHLIALYPALVDDLAEAHLDFERFARNYRQESPQSPVRPDPEQLAFWAGSWAGEYTYSTTIDVDAHRRVGEAWLPARYHLDNWPDEESRPGYATWASPYSKRWVPLTWIGLDYFKIARLVYDRFPGRLWAFSSATLGLGVWEMFDNARKPEAASGLVRAAIVELGLALEVYPSPPKSQGSLGQQHRRPCGMDSGVITETGVVTDPIEQIRLFKSPVTPSFDAIVRGVVERSRFYHSHSHDPDLWTAQAKEFDSVMMWMERGCPDCESVIRLKTQLHTGTPIETPIQEGVSLVCDETQEAADQVPEIFRACDIKAINRQHLWVEFVLFIADHGFPCDDSFLPVISTLAKWLWFYELYHLDVDERFEKTIELLCLYIENKNNGYVTRLENGDRDVFRHVERIVRRFTENVNDCGKQVFLQMRCKRDSGQYLQPYSIASMLDGSTSSISHLPLRSISCDLLSNDEDKGKWRYVPDDTPLPDEAMRKIVVGLRGERITIRKNKDGEYPTLKAITRLVNHLNAGEGRGRRISQDLLSQMGFHNRTRETIKTALYKIPVIHDGGYLSKTASRKYVLAKDFADLLREETEDRMAG